MSYKVVEVNGKKAIVDENGRKVSPEFDFIYEGAGLLKNESPYYIAAILVDTDNPEKELIAFEKDGKWVTPRYAIFDKDGNQISPEWFKSVNPDGLVEGEKELYLALREDGKWAIFNKDGKQISPEGLDWIFKLNFFKKEGDEVYAAVKDGKVAIFDEDGNQLAEWEKLETKWFEGPIIFKDKDQAKPETSKEETQKQENTVSDIFDKLNLPETIFEAHMDNRYNVKYFANLGILEIYDREKDSTTVIDLKYKDDVDLKKGPSAPGM